MQVVARADEQVTLNVGGYKYTTTVTTLRNAPAPSLFNAMFSGRHNLEPDEVLFTMSAAFGHAFTVIHMHEEQLLWYMICCIADMLCLYT